jgi:ribosomal protein S18 acetylase RimI-like enzyme
MATRPEQSETKQLGLERRAGRSQTGSGVRNAFVVTLVVLKDRQMLARLATRADAPEVARLAALMYASMGVVTDSEWLAHAASAFARRAGDDLVAYVVDRPQGEPGLVASGVGMVSPRLPSPHNPDGRVGYIQWVATEPAFRRRGLARQVLLGLLQWFEGRGVPVVELHATPEGEPLYRALGFGEEGAVALRRRAHSGAPPR